MKCPRSRPTSGGLTPSLATPKSLATVPEELVEGEREKREQAEDRWMKIVEALEQLKGAA